MEQSTWWKNSIVYEIYIRSFYDSNGDGIGDLRGIIEKLGYLALLGVNVLWLTPIYESPDDDNGYDISDYCSIMAKFGTMADFEELLREVHKRDMKLVMDLVVNHTSDEHPWFMESKKGVANPYRDYYIWQEGKDSVSPPNNWSSAFLGSAWEHDKTSGQYYLHLFSPKQPDLNWDFPPVRTAVYGMMKWWLDKGIDGFRMDVISLISKDANAFYKDSAIKGHTVCANGPRVHEFLKEMREQVLSQYDIMTVGETAAVTLEEAKQYASLDRRELDMVFQFELMDVDGGESGKWTDLHFKLTDVKKVLRKWQNGLHGQAWNSLFWNNHDQPRTVSRFGCTKNRLLHEKSAKMLATALYLLEGTPYLYQGEELGMTNMDFQDIGDLRDIESLHAYRQYVELEQSVSHEDMMRYLRKSSRDNARTPMQWEDAGQGGFTAGTPWIPVNPNYTWLNAKEQMADPHSIFHYYRQLLKIIKESEVVRDGDFEEFAKESESVYLYRRFLPQASLYVFTNFTGEMQIFDEAVLPAQAKRILGNYETHQAGILQPYEAIVYHVALTFTTSSQKKPREIH